MDLLVNYQIRKEKDMMKGFLNLFRNKETEEINMVVEMPIPNFSREMTIIESSEEEDNDAN